MRRMHGIDRWLVAGQRALQTIALPNGTLAVAPMPSPGVVQDQTLSAAERRLSGGLMRVNHVGEVCAQALYEGQAMAMETPQLREAFLQAAQEEARHLQWTAQRLDELGARPSLLNPLWYAGSFAMGLLASRLGERASLSFMAETERQVEQHLEGHLLQLPVADQRSRDLVVAMKQDEAKHAEFARVAGGAELPAPVRWLMRRFAAVMTRTARYI